MERTNMIPTCPANKETSSGSLARPSHQPLVSVVLTAHNGEKYLAAQIDSIVQQTYQHIEIIICNDASSDQTAQMIHDYAARDSRIITLSHAKNMGLHANLESGLNIAKGQLIAISDQDDIWRLNKIEKLVECMGRHAAAFSDSELIDGAGATFGKTLMQAMRIENPFAATRPLALLKKNCVSGHGLLFRREILSWTLPFDGRMEFDRQLAIAASLLGGLVFYPEPLVCHRIHDNNLTNHRFSKYNPTKNKPLKKTNSTARLERKNERYDEELGKLHLACNILTNLNNAQLAATGVPRAEDFRAALIPLVSVMEKKGSGFFNLDLFLALLKFDRCHQHYGLKRIIRLCKGPRWHQLFNARDV